MGGNNGDDGYRDFLHEVLAVGGLDETAAGITKLVIDKGEGVLSEKQRHVFKTQVLDIFVTEECTRCKMSDIPWSEMIYTHDNGGLCSWCAKMESNDD